MIFAGDLRRQARVCARLAEDCQDQHLAERLRLMATDLIAKADDIEELPTERLRRTNHFWPFSFHSPYARRGAAKLLSQDEARRIATNIATLPYLLRGRARRGR